MRGDLSGRWIFIPGIYLETGTPDQGNDDDQQEPSPIMKSGLDFHTTQIMITGI